MHHKLQVKMVSITIQFNFVGDKCCRETLHKHKLGTDIWNAAQHHGNILKFVRQLCLLDMYEEQAQWLHFSTSPCPRPDLAIYGPKDVCRWISIYQISYKINKWEAPNPLQTVNTQWYRVPIITQALVVNAGDIS